MDPVEKIVIEHECARLVHAYCQFVDANDYERLVPLWAEDAVWHTLAGPARGHAQIRKQLESRDPGVLGRHHCTNVLIDVIDASNAHGRSYFAFYRGVPVAKGPTLLKGPLFVGEYVDQFKLTSNGWRIASRRAVATMKNVEA